jgi:DNA-binding transcriptional ArsR family regulator
MSDDRASTDDLDLVWRALANPVRRAILDELKRGPLRTGELADRFADLSRFAVMQHLGVLEEGDLVIRRRLGRVTLNFFNPVPIQRIADRWIDRMRRPWTESLVDLKGELEAELAPGEEDGRAEDTDHAGGAAG